MSVLPIEPTSSCAIPTETIEHGVAEDLVRHQIGEGLPQLSMHSPVGPLTISEDRGAVVSLDWGWGRDQAHTDLLAEAVFQLNAYFDGDLTRFSVPLDPVGTEYRRRVWHALTDIRFGTTIGYGVLAGQIGGSGRSIGQASRHNPIPILIPCHRVVGSTSLGGYSAGEGPDVKTFLLDHERGIAARQS